MVVAGTSPGSDLDLGSATLTLVTLGLGQQRTDVDFALFVPVSAPLVKPQGQSVTEPQGQSSTEPPAQTQAQELSWTGAEAGLMALLGALMLTLGLALVRTVRRRRTE